MPTYSFVLMSRIARYKEKDVLSDAKHCKINCFIKVVLYSLIVVPFVL